MAGRQHLRAEFARGRQEIAELDRLVAIDARHRRLACDIARGKAVDDRLLEPALVIEDVVRDPDPLRHRSRIVNVLTGAAGTLAVGRRTVIVELQRHANDVIALGLEQCRRDRGIHAARHGDHDAGVARGTVEVEAVEHCVFRRAFPAPYYRHSIGASHARGPPDLHAQRRGPKAGCGKRLCLTRRTWVKALEQQVFCRKIPCGCGVRGLRGG